MKRLFASAAKGRFFHPSLLLHGDTNLSMSPQTPSNVDLLFHLIAYFRLIAYSGLLITSFKIFNCIVL